MTMMWAVFISLLVCYSVFTTVLAALFLLAISYWKKKADEYETALAITKSALKIAQDGLLGKTHRWGNRGEN